MKLKKKNSWLRSQNELPFFHQKMRQFNFSEAKTWTTTWMQMNAMEHVHYI